MALLERIIDSSGVTPAKGVPVSSLTLQHIANFYLGWCDRFDKEHQRVLGVRPAQPAGRDKARNNTKKYAMSRQVAGSAPAALNRARLLYRRR